MAQIVLGIGTSHTPMLNAPAEDWPRFIERDRKLRLLDKNGNPTSYDDLLRAADPQIAERLTPERFAACHAAAATELARVSRAVQHAALDALIVVGDDQKEIFHDNNMPSFLIYRGKGIRNVPLRNHPGPPWATRASSRFYEETEAREYPVDDLLAMHVISELIEREFDVSCADSLPEGRGEGHAFGFVHKRLQTGDLPVVPVFINTYFPPNQPTPRRCYALGRAIREAVEAYPAIERVGIVASGGLSHFTIDEELDRQIVAALQRKDAAALQSLPRNKLNSGASEIRNWICVAGAVEHLGLESLQYLPAYRTPAGTGTGLCFAVWR
jgi:hypothetical protein